MQVGNSQISPKPMTEEDNQLLSNNREAIFWATHPIKRALIAGCLTWFFTDRVSFTTGLIFGGFSGLTNLSLHKGLKKIDVEASPEAKAIKYLFAITFPWVVSYGIMKSFYKQTCKPTYYIPPRVAIGTSVAIEFFSTANFDLLLNKKSHE